MFLLFEVGSANLFLVLIAEPLEVLIFGVALVLLAIGLRWLTKRGKKGLSGDIEHTTK